LTQGGSHPLRIRRPEATANFTPTQGRYLAYIHAYVGLHGYPPAESDIAAAMCISPPSVNQMVKMLEKKGLVLRRPGQPRSLQILLPEDEIPPWNHRAPAETLIGPVNTPRRVTVPATAAPASLLVVSVYLAGGSLAHKFANKVFLRDIEIRGNQTLEQLHHAIFAAFDRHDQHLYEFQFGERPNDPKGPNYRIPDPDEHKEGNGDARTTTLDALGLKPNRIFGYLFDFGDEWFHQIRVERIEQAIPTVNYPRVIKRVASLPHSIQKNRFERCRDPERNATRIPPSGGSRPQPDRQLGRRSSLWTAVCPSSIIESRSKGWAACRSCAGRLPIEGRSAGSHPDVHRLLQTDGGQTIQMDLR